MIRSLCIALITLTLLSGCVKWFWGDLRTDSGQYAEMEKS